jgi:hypothetical protein
VFGTVLVRFAGTRTGAPLENLKRVLIAALETPYYRGALARAGFGTARAIRRLTSVEEGLEPLPVTPLADWRALGEGKVLTRTRRRPRSNGTLMASSDWLLRTAGGSAPPRLQHSIVALTSFGSPPLTDGDRESIWRAFRVPLFEHLLGPDGLPFATECAAHEALHVRTDRAILESRPGEILVTSLTSFSLPALRVAWGIPYRMVQNRCECGVFTDRLAAI